jgi:DNA-binding response OmpR family regulator
MKRIVLVVEDSPTQAKQIVSLIGGYNVKPIIAVDGLEALQLAASEAPVLIILDVNLPKMDGFQVCHRLKRDPMTCNIPIIMLTSADSSTATLHGLEVGADDYIPKDSYAMENLIATAKIYLQESTGK